MKNMNEKLDEINTRLERIETLLEGQKMAETKIVNHISFIEDVFDAVKKPLGRVLSYYGGGVQTDKLNKKIKYEDIDQ